MNSAYIGYYLRKLNTFIATKTAIVNHQGAISAEVHKLPGEAGILSGLTAPPSQHETVAQTRSAVDKLREAVRSTLEEALVPFVVTDTRLTFAEGSTPIDVSATLKRDYPLGDDERILLSRILEKTLKIPFTVSVKTVPQLPPLAFDENGNLTAASAASLAFVRQLPEGSSAFRFLLESPDKRTDKKAQRVKQYLIDELEVPASAIMVNRTPSSDGAAGIRLRTVRRVKGTL